MLPLLRLLRVGTLFSPAADVTAGLCLAGLPWTAAAVRALIASVCVYAAGMVLNDHADRHVDAELRPERPLPSGQIGSSFALTFGLLLLVAGVLVSPWRPYYAALALLVLAYDYVLKRLPPAGAVTMGLLRGLNLAAGSVALTREAPGEVIVICAGAYALYIVAVTVLGVLEDDPKVRPRVVVSVQTVPPLVGALAILAAPEPWPAAGFGFALAALFLARVVRPREWTQAAIRGSMTWLLLGTMLYTGLLCLAAGRWVECLVVVAAILPARWISKRIALT